MTELRAEFLEIVAREEERPVAGLDPLAERIFDACFEAELFRDEYREETAAAMNYGDGYAAGRKRAPGEYLVTAETLAEAIKARGAVLGVARRYGRFNDAYWQQSAAAILAALPERTEKPR